MMGSVYIGMPILNMLYSDFFMLSFTAYIAVQVIIYMMDGGVSSFILREFPKYRLEGLAKIYAAIINRYYLGISILIAVGVFFYYFFFFSDREYIYLALVFSLTASFRFYSMKGRAILLSSEKHSLVHGLTSTVNLSRFIVLPYLASAISLSNKDFLSLFALISFVELVIFEFWSRCHVASAPNNPHKEEEFSVSLYKVLKKSSVYFLLGLVSAVVFQIDRIVIPLVFDTEISLKYSYLYLVTFVVLYVVSPINTAFIPSLTSKFEADSNEFYREFGWYSLLIVLVSIGYLVFFNCFGFVAVELWLGKDVFSDAELGMMKYLTGFFFLMAISNVFFVYSFVIRKLFVNFYVGVGLVFLQLICLVLAVWQKELSIYYCSLPFLAAMHLAAMAASEVGRPIFNFYIFKNKL